MTDARHALLAACFVWSLGLASCARRPGSDVVVITLDTVRADHLGCSGHRGGLTPAIDRLAARGVLFEDASCTVPLTLPSHASLFTGRYPTKTGVRNNGTFVVPEGETTLAFRLATVLASADPEANARAAGALDSDAEARLRSLAYTSAGSLAPSPAGRGRGRDPKAMTDYLQRYDHAVGLGLGRALAARGARRAVAVIRQARVRSDEPRPTSIHVPAASHARSPNPTTYVP